MATYNNVITNVSGSVGIGTTDASSRLVVLGNSSNLSEPIATFRANGSQLGGAGVLDVQNSAGNSLLFVTGSGFVGLGISTPGVRLDVFAGGNTAARFVSNLLNTNPVLAAEPGIILYTQNNTAGNYMSITNRDASYNANAQMNFINVNHTGDSAINFVTRTGATVGERLRITSAGNVGVGTTNPSVALQVRGAGAANTYRGVIRIDNTSTDKWAGLSLPDSVDAADSNSNNYYFIGRGSAIANRVMSFHVPNSTDYGGGTQPTIVFYSTGADRLFEVEASTGRGYFKGRLGVGLTDPSAQLANTNTTDGIAAANSSGIQWKSTANDWAAVVIGRPASGNSYGLRAHSGGTTASDIPFAASSGAGTGTIRLLVTGAGNVGIGTATPLMGLHVAASIGNPVYGGLDGNGNEFLIRGNLYYDLTNSRAQPITTGFQSMIAMANNVGGIRFYTSPGSVAAGSVSTVAERMVIDPSGYVGIGLANPTNRLVVKTQTAAGFQGLEVEDYLDTTGMYFQSVSGGSWRVLGGNSYYYDSGNFRSDSTVGAIINLHGGEVKFYTNSGLTANTNYVPTARMTINSSGNVGIGTSSPGYLLDVSGSFRAQGSKKVFFNGNFPPNYANSQYIYDRVVQLDANFTPSAGGTDVRINNSVLQMGRWVVEVIFSGDLNGSGVGTSYLLLTFDTTVNNGANAYNTINPKLLINDTTTGTFYGSISGQIALSTSGNDIILTIAGSSTWSTGLVRVKFMGSQISGTAPTMYLTLPGTTTSASWIQQNSWVTPNGSSNMIAAYTANSERLRVDSSGNVGIGTTSYAARLLVSGSATAATPTMIVKEGVVSPTGGALAFEVENSAGTTILAVTGSGNVGIGTSIPNATFEVVGVSGSLFSVTDSLSGSLFSVNTISGLPILEVFSDNTLIAGAYNSNALVVTGSRVGVGSRNPGYVLDVAPTTSTARIGTTLAGAWPANTTYAFFGHNSLTQTGTGNYAIIQSNAGSTFVNASSGNSLSLRINDTAALTVDSSRNVGIGTSTSLNSPLDVYGTATASPSNTAGIVRFNSTATNALIFGTLTGSPFASYIQSGGGNQYPLSLNPLGANVGIGVTNPGTLLQLGSSAASTEMLRISANYSAANTQRGAITWHDTVGILGKIWTTYDGSSRSSLHFGGLYNAAYDQGIYLSIRGDGNVGVGSSSPTQKLDVNGAVKATNNVVAQGTLLAYTGAGVFLSWESTYGRLEAYSYTSSTYQDMAISPNGGNVGIRTSAPSNTLDVNGTARVRTISNATGNFATYSATGVLQQRTAAEVKTDIGLSNVQNLSVSQIFNNTGAVHGTRNDFANITDFGYQYVQGATNGPGLNSATQYYAWSIGLGSDYPYSGANSYAAQFAIGRNVVNPYMGVRFRENNVWGSWQKLAAGNADTLTTARTLWGQSFDGSANVIGNLTSVGNITGNAGITLTAAGTLSLVASGANVITATTSGTVALTIDTSQRVGIGTATMSRKLVVHGDDALINDITIGRGGQSPSATSVTNTVLGNSTFGQATSSQTGNVAVGYLTLNNATTGADGNVAMGALALNANTTAKGNVGIGYYAMSTITTASGSVAVGYEALKLATGADNTAIGWWAGKSISTATGNVAVGSNSLSTTTTGGANTAVGNYALYNATSVYNTAVGFGAGVTVSTGNFNTSVGAFAGGSISTQANSTAVGYSALANATGAGNSAFGYNAGSAITSSTKNLLLGGYTGNAGGLDIRTSTASINSNNIILSDGDGNIRARFDFRGAVGVGTTTAVDGYAMHVVTGSTNANTRMLVQSTGTEKAAGYWTWSRTADFGYFEGDSNGNFKIGSFTSNRLDLVTNNTVALTVDTSQNVGIGTVSTGGEALRVYRSSGCTLGIYSNTSTATLGVSGFQTTTPVTAALEVSSTAASVGTATSHPLRIVTVSGERMRIDTSGKVGIGTTNPTATLSVMCGTTQARINAVYTDYAGIFLNGSTTEDDYNFLSNASGSDKNLYINRPDGWDIRFRKNNGDQVTITSAGRVGIGTATPDLGFLHVNGVITNAVLTFSFGWLRNQATASGRDTFAFGTNVNCSIYGSDRIITGTEFNALSDYRTKNVQRNIESEEGLRFIEQVNPVIYTWKSDERKELKYGFIAQDVLKAGFGPLVGIQADEKIEEYTDEEGFTSPKGGRFVMCYDNIVPLLSAAMRGLKQENNSLKSEIQSLKDQISSILALLNNK